MNTAKKRFSKTQSGLMGRYLDWIEIAGNKMPNPFMMFAYLALFIVLLSALLSWLGVGAYHPQTGDRVEVFNMLSSQGITQIFSGLIPNFTGFAPLGLVLVTMLAIGTMDQTGLLSNLLKSLVLVVPKRFITMTLVFVAVLSSIAADAGFVVIIPLGAVLFASMGRHPIAGIAAAFAGVAGGFGANILITPGDALLGGISQAAVYTIDSSYTFNIVGNWFFMIVSHILLTLIGTVVTEKIVEPRLGVYEGSGSGEIEAITPLEKKAMRASGIAFLITAFLLSLLIVPSWGALRGDSTIVASPFFRYLVPILFVLFLVPGLVYGRFTKQFNSASDIVDNFTGSVTALAPYIVLVFTASQFISFFGQSNLGIILAINGGEFLYRVGFTGFGLIVAFMLLSAFVNLFIGSASAQWLLFAPIFIPMFMQLGYTPEFTQMVYRVGDSITNPVSPLFQYLPLILTFAQKYDKKAGLGTIISTMTPYSLFFGIFWFLLVGIWMFFGLPIGPGAYIWM